MKHVLLCCALCVAFDTACAQDTRVEARRLADIGQYDDAERVARAGGLASTVVLGDILTARGKRLAADSAYTRASNARTPDHALAEAALAEFADARGDHVEASRRAREIISAYDGVTGNSSRSSDQHAAAGRAYVVLMSGDAPAARRALAAFDAAAAADSTNLDALRRAGDLFLEKYNAPDARTSYETVLRRAPHDARALLGIARIEDFEGKGTALATVRRSLTSNPALTDALVLVARMQLDAEMYDSASVFARRALAIDSASMPGWSLLGATAWLTGDSITFTQARAAAMRLQARPSDFYTELAEAAVRQRRYADAIGLAQQAVTFDSSSVRALGVLGTNQLRVGSMREGRQALDRAFALDPFNLWHKNTLDLLDKLRGFRTIDQGVFRVVAPAEEAEVLSMYIIPLLQQAFDSLAIRYAYTPPTPVRLEFYRQHADFSVRSVGLTGLGALGVSFGSLLAMDTPSARDLGAFNWGSTAWHELTHAFTLGASAHRVPRWLSEGMSVLEERRTKRGWGAEATLPYISALGSHTLRPMSQLNDGFLRPRFPEETMFSYYQASLFCEMVEELKGAKALPAMLTAYRDGSETAAVFQKVLGLTSTQVDEQFDAWMRVRFAAPLRAVTPGDGHSPIGGAFITTMRAAIALVTGSAAQRDSARVMLEQARAMFPTYPGADGPNWYLATLAKDRGDTASAIASLAQITTRNETAWEANMLEAELREQHGDDVGAMAALTRLIWISPYDVAVHKRLAILAAKHSNFALAVRERRAVIAVHPLDVMDARYELAKALAAAGDTVRARRELLQLLELVPSFEKAQELLLELRGKGSAGALP